MSGVRCDWHENLQSHGNARYLSHDVSHGASGWLQRQQVGDAVQHTADEKHKEVKAGHGQRRSNQGVDGTQEEERQDVLQVVMMSSGGDKCFRIRMVVWRLLLCLAWLVRLVGLALHPVSSHTSCLYLVSLWDATVNDSWRCCFKFTRILYRYCQKKYHLELCKQNKDVPKMPAMVQWLFCEKIYSTTFQSFTFLRHKNKAVRLQVGNRGPSWAFEVILVR